MTSVFNKNLVTELIYFYIILICFNFSFPVFFFFFGGGLLIHHINTNLLTKAKEPFRVFGSSLISIRHYVHFFQNRYKLLKMNTVKLLVYFYKMYLFSFKLYDSIIVHLNYNAFTLHCLHIRKRVRRCLKLYELTGFLLLVKVVAYDSIQRQYF